MDNGTEILKKINSGEPELAAEAVREIKENGDLAITEALLSNLENIGDPRIVTLIVNLLADIKDNKFRDILIREIKKPHSAQIKSELLRIVWESSLDYSGYLDFFLELLQQEDFAVAFEASTIIENMVCQLTEEQLHRLHHIVEVFPADKQYLIENIHAEMESLDEE